MSGTLRTTLTVLCAAVTPGSVFAQDAIDIEPAAFPVPLVMEEVFAIGSLNGEHDAFGRVMDIAVDGRGRIFVADDALHHVKVFSADGRYEGTIGRQGEGPGEFNSPWNVSVDRTDSLFVWDVGRSRITIFTAELAYARSFVVPPQWVINDIVFDASGNLVLAAYTRGQERGIVVLDRNGKRVREAGGVVEDQDLAGFEDSLMGGSLSAFEGGFAYARKSPVEITLFDAALRPLTVCAGARSWTTAPADVVVRTERGAGLRWNKYVHVTSVVGLREGYLLQTIRNPITESTKLQLLTRGCELAQTIDFPFHITPAERRGDLVYATRTRDYPEVVVYRIGG